MVLLHPVGLHGGWWESHAADLDERFHVIAIDLPGHGASSVPASIDLEMAADTVAALLDHLGLDEPIVVGVSLGGMVAQRLTRTTQLGALVLVSTAGWLPDTARAAVRARADQIEVDGLDVVADQTIERWFDPVLVSARAPVVERARDELRELDGPVHGAWWRAIAEVDELDHLRSFERPALVVAGTEDRSIPIELAAMLASALPHGEVWPVEGGSHMLAFESDVWLSPLVASIAR